MENLKFLMPISLKRKIRLGPNKDGGYVLYEPALKNVDLLLTYGVGWDIDFEIDFYNLTEKKILMYDPTMFREGFFDKSIYLNQLKHGYFISAVKYIKEAYRWKKELQRLEEYGIRFLNEGISVAKHHKYDTFQNQLKKNGIDSEHILLKIDIEENEYPIFQDRDFMNNLNRVDQMIVEFHNLKNRLRELESIVSNLSEQYYIIHIHGNNCSPGFTLYNETNDIYFPDVVEITFLRKTSVFCEDIVPELLNYPDPVLDYPNVSYSGDFNRLVFS